LHLLCHILTYIVYKLFGLKKDINYFAPSSFFPQRRKSLGRIPLKKLDFLICGTVKTESFFNICNLAHNFLNTGTTAPLCIMLFAGTTVNLTQLNNQQILLQAFIVNNICSIYLQNVE